MRYSRAQRISRDADIRRVQKEGKLVRTRHFSIRACASPLSFPRVGIIVPRHGQTAVNRNLLKRRLREVLRTGLLPRSVGLDVIVRAAPRAYGLPFAAIRAEIDDGVARAFVLKQE